MLSGTPSVKAAHCVVLYILGALSSFTLSSCAAVDRLQAGARVSPIIGRSAADRGAGGFPIEPGVDVKQLRLTPPRPVDLDVLTFPDIQSPTAYQVAANDAKVRNRLQDYLRRISDEVCLIHSSDILAVSAEVNGTLSATTSLLGGLGAIFTGANTARALAGSAGITNAWREDFNQNVYYNNFANAIVRQISLQRQQKLQEIQPRQSENIASYSVDAAIRDIGEYHDLCSFSLAVAALGTETKRPSSVDELRGRLETLRSEYSKNSELIKKATAAEQIQLRRTNEGLLRMMQSLTSQLGLAQGVPTTQQPAASGK